MMRFVEALLLGCALCLLGALGGCAFGTRHPTLVYPPDAYPEGSPGYLAPAPPATAPPAVPKIVVGEFVDERKDKDTVGTVRNGYGIRTAKVVATNSVVGWVRRAVIMELTNAGYSIVASEDGRIDADTPVVTVSVLNAFCDMYLDFNAEVVLGVDVRKAGRSIVRRDYAGKGNSGIAIAATSESYAQSLALALAAAARHFVGDLGQMLAAP